MFNEILEGGLNQLITGRLGMKGGAAAPAVAPELFPTLNLENDRPEWGYLKGELLAAKQVFVAAVAAQFGAAQIYIPSGNNLIAVIENISPLVASTANISRIVGIGGGVAGWAAATVATRDFRWPGERTGVVVETRTGVANPSTFPQLAQMSSASGQFNQPIVIAPGTGVVVACTVVNQVLSFNLSWRERPALPGELV